MTETEWIPIQYKMQSRLYECIVTTHKADGSKTYSVQYALNFQGRMVRLMVSPDFTTEAAIVEKICELIPSLSEAEAVELWINRELCGLI